MDYFPPPDQGRISARNQHNPLKVNGYRMVSGQSDRLAGSMAVYGSAPSSSTFEAEIAQTQTESRQEPSASSFGFFDFLDIINPLQHIPIVNLVYRHITGDEIGAVAQMAGGALFGGPIGAAAGLACAVVEHETGKDLGDAVMGLFDSPAIAAVDLSQQITRTRSAYND